jgi:cell division septum initiation protein DivIVA
MFTIKQLGQMARKALIECILRLLKRIRQLEQRVKELERRLARKRRTALTAIAPHPVTACRTSLVPRACAPAAAANPAANLDIVVRPSSEWKSPITFRFMN